MAAVTDEKSQVEQLEERLSDGIAVSELEAQNTNTPAIVVDEALIARRKAITYAIINNPDIMMRNY